MAQRFKVSGVQHAAYLHRVHAHIVAAHDVFQGFAAVKLESHRLERCVILTHLTERGPAVLAAIMPAASRGHMQDSAMGQTRELPAHCLVMWLVAIEHNIFQIIAVMESPASNLFHPVRYCDGLQAAAAESKVAYLLQIHRQGYVAQAVHVQATVTPVSRLARGTVHHGREKCGGGYFRLISALRHVDAREPAIFATVEECRCPAVRQMDIG